MAVIKRRVDSKLMPMHQKGEIYKVTYAEGLGSTGSAAATESTVSSGEAGTGGETGASGSSGTADGSSGSAAATESTVSSGEAGTGGETGASGSNESYAPSYEEYYGEQRDITYAAAEEERKRAEEAAETERQRGVIDAQASYNFNKATYGQNAEVLRSMGLTGSGYADYLTSRAYATQRSETQAVNAQAAEAKRIAQENEAAAKLAADATYAENIQGAKSSADATYLTLLDASKTGTYNLDELIQAAKDAGCSTEQIQALTSSFNQAEKDNEAAKVREAFETYLDYAKSGTYSSSDLQTMMIGSGLGWGQMQQILATADQAFGEKKAANDVEKYNTYLGYAKSGNYTFAEFKELVNAAGFDLAERNNLITAYQDANAATYSANLAAYNSDPASDIYKAYQNKEISEEDFKAFQNQINEDLDIDGAFKNDDGTRASLDAAQSALNDLLNNPMLTEETKTVIQARYDSIYVPKTIESFEVYYGLNEGNWVTFEDTSNDKRYKAKTAEVIDDSEVLAAASSYSKGTLFALNGKLYYKSKQGDKVWLLDQWASDTGYDRLMKVFGLS